MNIDQFTTDVNQNISARSARARHMLLAALLIFIEALVIAACSSTRKITLQGNEFSSCSSDIHLTAHTVVCEQERRGNWVSCVMSGGIENNGTVRAPNVIVMIEFGRVLNGMRSSTFNLLGDLDPGEKNEFKNNFSYYEPLTEYDIKVECDSLSTAQPTHVQENSFANSSTTLDAPLQIENTFLSLGPNDDVLALIIDPMVSTTLYAGTLTQGILKSIDGGSTWTASSNGLGDGTVKVLAIDPLQPAILYATTYDGNWGDGGIYKSVDSGENWIGIMDGMTEGTYVNSLVIDPLTPSTVYIGTSKGLFKSTNGGDEWRMLNTSSSNSAINSLTIDPLTPTNLYAVDYGTSVQRMILSINGGDSWREIGAGLLDKIIFSLAIDPLTPTTLYVGTGMGMYKSTNAGESWEEINTGLDEFTITYALAIDPVNPSTIYVAQTKYGGDLFISTNSGENWYPLNTNLSGIFVHTLVWDPINPMRLYAATEQGVFVVDR